MLSNASKYTIKAMLYLMMHASKDNKIGAKVIAKDLNIPEPFLAKLLQQLVRFRLLSSTKGPKGGFYISKQNAKHSICDILEVIEGQELFNDCFMELEKCDALNPCPVHFIVADFKVNLYKKFKQLNLQEFTDEIDINSNFLQTKQTF